MHFGKSRVFLSFCLAFITGVFFGRYLDVYILVVAAAIFIIIATIGWGQRKFLLIGFLGLVVLLGAWRYQKSFPDTSAPNFIGQYYGQEITIEGVVVEDPDVRSDKTNLTIRPDGLQGKILVNAGRHPERTYGDRLKLSGKIEEPFESEEFSYKNYLSRYGVYGLLRFPDIEQLDEGQGHLMKAGLLAVKHKFQEVLSKILPEPHNAFVMGLLLGIKRAILEDLREAFILTGVSHIVVISGYNISILTRNILKTRRVIGRRAAFWFSLTTVLAFVVLSGAEASVIRAAIMGMLLVFALNIGRMYSVVNALVFTGAIMIALNPQILVFDVGFQLSFLATLGLIFLSPIFDRWLKQIHIPNFFYFRTNLSSTLSAQLFTLPILIFYFDRISLIAPLVNMLILWAIPYTMFFGFFVGLLGIISLPVGTLLAGVPWVLLELMIRVVEFFAQFKFAATSASISIGMIIIYYLLLIGALALYRYKKQFWYYLEYVEMKL